MTPPASAPIRVVQYGIGPIGLASVAALLEKQALGRIELVGAVDIDPEKVGRDVGALLPEPQTTGIEVTSDIAATLEATRPDVVLHTTSSFLPRIVEQIETCLAGGAHIVSSAEELAYPWRRQPEFAQRIDAAARRAGRAVLGTGVNPGFAMDALALTATAPCRDVQRVDVLRVVDAGRRRGPLQRKVGAGLTVEAFEERRAAGGFGHIGLPESLDMLAAGLGVTLDRVEELFEPVRARADVDTGIVQVKAGDVAGIRQRIEGWIDGAPRLTLELQMFVGAENPRDAVRVDGDPPIDLVVEGGIFGDTATVAALVNAIPQVYAASAGLRTALDLPLPRAFAPTLGTRRALV